MRVLVCGGRNYVNADRVYLELDMIHKHTPITCIIEGGAKGADHLGFLWSCLREMRQHQRFRAEWKIYGKAAGPKRNLAMLVEGKPDLVIAFPDPDSRGTWDMVEKAKKAGVKTIVIE